VIAQLAHHFDGKFTLFLRLNGRHGGGFGG
jgi:hypothetical protein